MHLNYMKVSNYMFISEVLMHYYSLIFVMPLSALQKAMISFYVLELGHFHSGKETQSN